MSETKRSALQSWLPVVLTLAMLLTSLGFRGGTAESAINGLREDFAAMSRSMEETRKDMARISEQLVEARGYREGLQTRLVILERRLDDVEKRHGADVSEIKGSLASHVVATDERRERDLDALRKESAFLKSLVDNNKGSIRLVRGRLDAHIFGNNGEGPEEGDP